MKIINANYAHQTTGLTKYDLERYDRQMRINGFGSEGQRKLKNARVLIAGAGGLGFSTSVYLVSAGIGTIRIVDKDVVELSNLNRQLLHWDEDIGRKKVESAYEKLRRINSSIKIEVYDKEINEDNVLDLMHNVDAVVDALDNYETRYTLNKACLKMGKPFFHGAVRGFMGQATTIIPRETACLKCIVPKAPPRETFPILGSVAGTIGTIQATEVIKYFTGIGDLLKNKLLIYDAITMEVYKIEIGRNPTCPDCSPK
jgi:adenylyltransferase/sulfurtransferase